MIRTTNFEAAFELLDDKVFKDAQLFLDLIIYFESMGNKYKSGMILNACDNEISEKKCFELLLKTLSTKEIYTLLEYKEINKTLFTVLARRITIPSDDSFEQLSLLISTSPILFNKSLMLIKELTQYGKIEEPLFNEFQSKSFMNYYQKNKVLKYAISLC